jgi:hypothetical protein
MRAAVAVLMTRVSAVAAGPAAMGRVHQVDRVVDRNAGPDSDPDPDRGQGLVVIVRQARDVRVDVRKAGAMAGEVRGVVTRVGRVETAMNVAKRRCRCRRLTSR